MTVQILAEVRQPERRPVAAGASPVPADARRDLENMRILGISLITYCGPAFAGGALNLFSMEAADHTIAIICQMLDPELVILSGGIAQNNSLLVSSLLEAVPRRIMSSQMRRLKIVRSELGYYAGVFGAGAIARDKWLTHEH